MDAPTSSPDINATEVDGPTTEQLISIVARLDPELKQGSETFNAALVLLASLSTGTGHGCRKRIAKLTGVPYHQVLQFARRLTSQGVFRDGGIAPTFGPWDEDPIAFWSDVNVALGIFEVVRPTSVSLSRDDLGTVEEHGL